MITIEFPGVKITPSTLPITEQNFRVYSYIFIEGFCYHWIYSEEKGRIVYIFEDFEWRRLSEEEIDNLDEIGDNDLFATKITIE